jgi:hypothetical protein
LIRNPVILDLPVQPVELLDVEVRPQGDLLHRGDDERFEELVKFNGCVLRQFRILSGFELKRLYLKEKYWNQSKYLNYKTLEYTTFN